jgi:diguanylate cyclase (GGDEF)-like protein
MSNLEARITELEAENRQLAERLLEVSTVYQVSRALSLSVLTENLLDMTGAIFSDVLGVQGFLLLIPDDGGKRWEPVAVYRNDGSQDLPPALRAAEGPLKAVLAADGPTLWSAGLADWWPEAPESFAGELLLVPVRAPEGPTIGVLVVAGGDAVSPSRRGVFGHVAEQLAVALENARAIAEARALSNTDPLTKLYNRRYLEDRLQRELHRAERYDRLVSLVVVDMDRFKDVNDTHGHDVGDDLLREVGELFRRTVRQSDVVARFGGDEFVLVLPETGKPDALRAVEKLLAELASSKRIFRISGGALAFSAGVATFPEDARQARDLFRRADRALYAAKGLGGSRVLAAPARPGDG